MSVQMHHVFVYGTLRSGCRNRTIHLPSCESIEAVAAPEFTLRTLGRFPMVHRGGDTAIRGEVLALGDDELAAVDRLEGHPDWYQREVIEVQLAGGGTAQAWIYLMPPESHQDAAVIASGDWVEYLRGL
ncbi:MAG: gamma-glutamylcyclotransferase family protein, partial [Phycisphaerales bacterium]|nr:gamma-glutamylcyclotransferase family protein [Phycisphaerales bacterium]